MSDLQQHEASTLESDAGALGLEIMAEYQDQLAFTSEVIMGGTQGAQRGRGV